MILNLALLPDQQLSITEHGLESLERVLEFFGDVFDRQDVQNSYLQFKYLLNVNRHLSLQEMCLQVINDHCETFPGFSKRQPY